MQQKQTRINSLISTLLLILLYNTLHAQDSNCDDFLAQVKPLQDRYTRLDIEQVKHTTDSLFPLIPVECKAAQMYAITIYARYENSKNNFDKSQKYHFQALKIAGEIKDPHFQKHIVDMIANQEEKKGNPERSIHLRDSAILFECHPDSIYCFKQNIRLTINNAYSYMALNDTRSAIDKFKEGERKLIEYEMKDSVYRLVLLNGLGDLYYDAVIPEYNNSIKYYKEALSFCPVNHRHKLAIQTAIANSYLGMKQLDSASIVYMDVINNTDRANSLIIPYQGLGDIKLAHKKYNEAIQMYQQALDYSVKANNSGQVDASKGFLAKALFYNGNYNDADALLSDLVNINSQPRFNSQNLAIERYYFLNRIALYNPSRSTEVKEHFDMADSLTSEERFNTLNQSIIKYEKLILRDSLEKQKILKEYEEKKSNNYKLTSLSALLGLLLVSLLAFQFKNRFIKQKEINSELVFKNEELASLNIKLKTKVDSIKSKNKLSKDTPIVQFISNGNTFLIEPTRITHVQAEDEGTRIHYDDTSNWADIPLKEFRIQLENLPFVQIFRSTIVNFHHVGWVNTTSLKLKNGTELKIGRTYKQAIKEAIQKAD